MRALGAGLVGHGGEQPHLRAQRVARRNQVGELLAPHLVGELRRRESADRSGRRRGGGVLALEREGKEDGRVHRTDLEIRRGSKGTVKRQTWGVGSGTMRNASVATVCTVTNHSPLRCVTAPRPV